MKEIAPSSTIEISKGISQHVLPGYEEEVASLLTKRKKDELDKYFTNPGGRVTAWRGSPRDMTAAVMTARESRAGERDVTELFWKEFREKIGEQVGDRILNEFGDDSVREDGSAYLYIKDISVITSMNIFFRHPLITGIEASTRYINWSELPIEEFVVYPESIMNDPEAKETYTEAVKTSYDAYKELWPTVWNYMVATNPKPETMKDGPYRQAIKGAVCDALRGLLLLGSRTNLALHDDFRSLTELLMDMQASDFEETREVAKESVIELNKVNPVFMKVIEDHGNAWTDYKKSQEKILKDFGEENARFNESENYDLAVKVQVVNKDWLKDLYHAAIIYNNGGLTGHYEHDLAMDYLSNVRLEELLKEVDSVRKNRRDKVDFLNAIILNISVDNLSFGSFKDLNRQRPLLFKSQPDWSGKRGWNISHVIKKMGGDVEKKFNEAQEKISVLREQLAVKFPEESKLLLTHATKTAFKFVAGLTEAFWIWELRSLPSNNPENRDIAIGIYNGTEKEIPLVSLLQKFVDKNEYELGRIREAIRADLKGK